MLWSMENQGIIKPGLHSLSSEKGLFCNEEFSVMPVYKLHSLPVILLILELDLRQNWPNSFCM